MLCEIYKKKAGTIFKNINKTVESDNRKIWIYTRFNDRPKNQQCNCLVNQQPILTLSISSL